MCPIALITSLGERYERRYYFGTFIRRPGGEKMPDALPSVADSRKLYEIMQQIHVLAPWEWMEETNIFGVQSPDTQELGFVSIMGMAGEHYAVSVYLGARALYDLWRFEDEAPDIAPEKLLEIPQLMASFEDRSQLNKKDLDLIKS